MASRYKLWYRNVVVPDLIAKMQYKNVHQVPEVKKITLSAATNVTTGGLNHPVAAAFALELISGMRPNLTRVKRSNARYKVRAGFLEGAMVKLEGDPMYDFMDRLITFVLPRITDFNGLSNKSFDGLGDYSIGIKDWGYFPEIDAQHSTFDAFQMSSARGIGISIHTNAKTDMEAKLLLSGMRFPFEKKT